MAKVRAPDPSFYHAVRDPGRGALDPAPIFAGLAAADPAGQTLPALVDADLAGAFLHVCHHHRSGHDHPGIFPERALFSSRPGNSPADKTGPGYSNCISYLPGD